ncbi:MAG: glycosyl hydrolase, partial [Bacteroidota bacterium]
MKKIVVLILLIIALVNSCEDPLKQQFQSPPDIFKPMPFWHINGEMTTEGIRQQMEDARKLAGFSGVSVLPLAPRSKNRPGTTPKFLTDEYLDRFQDVLDMAEELDMQVILYDDNDFPSGMAGGKLGELYPEHTMKRLDKIEKEVTGPVLLSEELPEGKLLSAVAMNLTTQERIELSAFVDGDQINWNVPRGEWKIMYFPMVVDSYHKAFPVVDYLDSTAVRHMINLTYDVYEEHFGDYFGNTIKMTFFDDIGFWRHPRTWTGLFNEKFETLYGYDPRPWYPALWYDIGPETESVRHAFFNTRAELLAEGFPKLVGEWTAKRGLKDTGHPPGNYDPTPVDMNGDIFKFYRHTAVPLMDAIKWYEFGRDGHKLISSAADYYDRPVVATEVYGAFKENAFDSLMLYRAIMDLFARGVNFVVPHGMWYNPEQVYIQPLVSPYSEKIAPALPAYSNFVGRSCLLLQGGRRVADIGMIYPFADLAGWYRFDDPADPRQGFFVSPQTDYQDLSNLLSNKIRKDFTFIHPEYFLDEKYQIGAGEILLGNEENEQQYKVLILPGSKVISYNTLEKIKDFYQQGGKVIATTMLPIKSTEMGQNQKVMDVIQEIFGLNPMEQQDTSKIIRHSNENGGQSIFIPRPDQDNLSRALDQYLIPDIQFFPNPNLKSKQGSFNYIHKVKDGKNIYFFTNSSDDAIETEVILKGKLNLENWNPHTGTTFALENVTYIEEEGQTFTK